MEWMEHKTFDEERALYGKTGLTVRHCSFDGPADGESALKECRDVVVEDSLFNLRYPCWHDRHLKLAGCRMTQQCRAALWYSEGIQITDTELHGIKALRECDDVELRRCDIDSPEFGWSCRNVRMEDTRAVSQYFMLRGENLDFVGVEFRGKYSFQYIQNAVFENCTFDTKDAFWHGHNVTVRNSLVKGEYLGWYSDGLTLEHCKIVGTQPLCYCKHLKLVDCEMVDTDLCFEKSQVEATITTPVVSIKNPYGGTIVLPSVGELIRDDPSALGRVVTGGAQSQALGA